MEEDDSGGRSSILEEIRLDYEKIGLHKNPFESIPIFSELEPVEPNDYMKGYVESLSHLIYACVETRPGCVYLVGQSGSGKSAILNLLTRTLHRKGGVFPVCVRFPLSGGKTAFYAELLRSLPNWLLSLMFQYAHDYPSRLPPGYLGTKVFQASFAKDLQRAVEKMRISPQYATSSIDSLCSLILTLTESKRIALILDEFEHAWMRFTGGQKYDWERAIVELLLRLESKIILVFPLWPERAIFKQRPYLNLYKWEKIDMDLVMGVSSNMVEIECSQTKLRDCFRSLASKHVVDERGKQLCDSLLEKMKDHATIGEAILDLHDQTLRLGSGRQTPWE